MPLMVALRNRERRGHCSHAAPARYIPTYVHMMKRSRSPHSGKGTTSVTHHNSINLNAGSASGLHHCGCGFSNNG